MLIQHFNERAQVHRYNCSNLLLQVSAVGFFAGSFTTRLGGRLHVYFCKTCCKSIRKKNNSSDSYQQILAVVSMDLYSLKS